MFSSVITHCCDQIPSSKFFCGQPQEYLTKPATFSMGQVSLTKTGDLFALEMTLSKDFADSESGSEFLRTYQETKNEIKVILDHKNLKQIVHSMSAVPFLGFQKALTGTDRPLSEWKVLNEDSDRLSPDYMDTSLKNKVILVEFSAPEGVEDRSFENKKAKYFSSIEKRFDGRDIIFGIVVCSPRKILSNIPLTDSLVMQISIMRDVGVFIKNYALAAGWLELDVDIEKARILLSGRNGIIERSISVLPEHPDKISQTLLDHWNKWDITYSFAKVAHYLHGKREWMNSPPAWIMNDKCIEDFRSRMSEGARKTTMKSVCRVPLISTATYYETGSRFINYAPIESYQTPLSSIWSKAFRAALVLPESLRGFSSLTSDRSKFGRIEIDFSREEMDYLNSRGIYSKSRPDPVAKFEAKVPYSLDTDTSDIDFFVNERIFELLRMSSEATVEGFYNDKLIEYAKSKNGTDLSTELVTMFSRTAIGKCLHLQGCILEELNLDFNKPCPRGEMIIKKIKGYDVYLLIRSIAGNKPLWYSILAGASSTNEANGLFLKSHNFGMIDLFDFECLNRHKMANYMFPFEKALSLLVMWAESYNISVSSVFTSTEPEVKEVVKHWAVSLLFLMEGKSQTSSEVMLLRYCYMELMKFGIYQVPALKILSKMDAIPRSRLLVWFYQKLISNVPPMQRSFETRPVFVTPEEAKKDDENGIPSTDKVLNLYSIFTGGAIPTLSCALNLMYLCVLHNKDEADEVQGDIALFSKIIKGEIARTKVRPEYTGWEEPVLSDLRVGEFSVDFCLAASTELRDFLRSKYGNYSVRLEENMSKEVFWHKWDKIATFKSSAVRPSSSSFDLTDEKSTRRVLEGVMEQLNLTTSVHLFSDLPRMLDYLENRHLMASMFLKLQLGGTRGIYILDIVSRLVALFLETLSRSICKDLPHEMLTKGSEKIMVSDSHSYKVSSARVKGYSDVTVCSSDDASTWNLNWNVKAFGCIFSRLLPESWMKVVSRILNLWPDKKLRVPNRLIRKFVQRPDASSMSYPEIDVLKNQMLGRSDETWLCDEDSLWLKNKCGFMEGILHYTSSLAHAAALLVHEKICKASFQAEMRKVSFPAGSSIITTYLNSSDDSGFKASILIPESFKTPEVTKKCAAFLTQMCVIKKEMYPLFCSRQSEEKSTVASFTNLFEFNSHFMSQNSLSMPVIKFVYASLMPSPVISLISRQHVASGGRKTVLENGGTFQLVSVLQHMQAIVHYKCLGKYVSDYFSDYRNSILMKPVPELGFFVFEKDLICGLFGVDFATYDWIREVPQANYVTSYIFNRVSPDVEDQSTRPSLSLDLNFGDLKKYRKFAQSIGLVPGWRKQVSESKELEEFWFRDPVTITECKHSLMKKASSSGAPQAMTFQARNRLHTSSVYVLDKPCLRLRRADKDEIEMVPLLDFVKSFVCNTPLTDREISFLFPLSETYDRALNVIAQFGRQYKIQRDFIPANKMVTFKMYRSQTMPSMSLISVARKCWFSENSLHQAVRGTKAEMKEAMEFYKSTLPWFADTLEETLLRTKMNVITLSELVKSYDSQPVSFSILGPVKKGMPFDETLRNIIRNCQSRVYYLGNLLPTDKEPIKDLGEKLVLIVTGVGVQADKVQKCFEAMRDSPLVVDLKNAARSRQESTDRKLALIQLHCKRDLYNFQLYINQLKEGKFGFYRKSVKERSSSRPTYGSAIYSGFIEGAPFHARLEGAKLEEMIFRDWQSFYRVRRSLSAIIDDERWELPTVEPKIDGIYCSRSGNVTNKRSGSFLVNFNPLLEEATFSNEILSLKVDPSGRIVLANVHGSTILSFYPAPWRLRSMDPVSVKGSGFSDYWISKNALPVDKLFELTDKITAGLSSSDPVAKGAATEMRTWVITTLTKRVVARTGDVLSSAFKVAPTDTISDAPILDFDINYDVLSLVGRSAAIAESDDNQRSREKLTPASAAEVWDDFELDFDDQDNLYEDGDDADDEESAFDLKMQSEFLDVVGMQSMFDYQQISGTTQVDIAGNHRYWDLVISEMIEEGTKPSKLLFSSTQVAVNGDVSNCISILTENHLRSQPVSRWRTPLSGASGFL